MKHNKIYVRRYGILSFQITSLACYLDFQNKGIERMGEENIQEGNDIIFSTADERDFQIQKSN